MLQHQTHNMPSGGVQCTPNNCNNVNEAPQHKAFVCEICGKAFRFRSNLAEHRSVHTAVKPFVCKFCGKSSRLKGNLTKHILKHHKVEQKEYIGTDDYIIKKGKKSVKDPAAIEFLEKSMIVLNNGNNSTQFMHAPGSQQSADSGGTEQNGGDLDGHGILLSLGLDAGSLDLKDDDEAMEEEEDAVDNDGDDHFSSHHQEVAAIEQNNDDNGNYLNTTNQQLLEHCESAISGSGQHEDDELEECDANGTVDEDVGDPFGQSSGEQSPLVTTANCTLDTAGANALATAACKALFFGQMDNKTLAKALFGGSSGGGRAGSAGMKGLNTTSSSSSTDQQQATNDEIMRILHQVSSMAGEQHTQRGDQQTEQQQSNVAVAGPTGADHHNHHQQQQQLQQETAAGTIPSASKLATQCQLCGKHFRKPRDLITHLASNVHKLSSFSQPANISNNNNNINQFNSLLSSNNHSQLLDNNSQSQQRPNSEDGSTTTNLVGGGRSSLLRSMLPSSSSSMTTNMAATPTHKQHIVQQHHQTAGQENGAVVAELRELRATMVELRTAVGGGTSKLEQMLGQLDSRVCRLEKQLEMALNSIYTLVQLQTGINNNVQKLASSSATNCSAAGGNTTTHRPPQAPAPSVKTEQ